MDNAGTSRKKIKVALVRGDNLQEQEAKLWEDLGEGFEVEAFCGRKNVFPLDNINLKINRLPASSDNFFTKNFFKYFFGQYKRIFGLENKLLSFDVAHGGEAYNYYTLQCVKAKKHNPELKVVASFVDNVFGRFEYNYWPGFKVPPKYWRDKINGVIKESIKGVDLFIANTNYSAELLYDLGARPDQVKVVYLGVPVDNCDDAIMDRLNLRGTEYSLVICRLVWEKGIYDILYGWRMYLKRSVHRGQKLVILGNGREEKNFRRLIFDLGLKDSVILTGSVPNKEVKQLYRNAYATLVGSQSTRNWQEQQSSVLREAVKENCPIISTDSGANPELVGTAGVMVPAGNPVEFGKALLKLEDPVLYADIKKNGLEEKKKFDSEDFKRKIADAYLSLF